MYMREDNIEAQEQAQNLLYAVFAFLPRTFFGRSGAYFDVFWDALMAETRASTAYKRVFN